MFLFYSSRSGGRLGEGTGVALGEGSVDGADDGTEEGAGTAGLGEAVGRCGRLQSCVGSFPAETTLPFSSRVGAVAERFPPPRQPY